MSHIHTATPYKIAAPGDEVYIPGTITVCTANGERSIADIVGDAPIDHQNAEFIVVACNNHAYLKTGIENVLTHDAGCKPEYKIPQSLNHHLIRLLAKARGEA